MVPRIRYDPKITASYGFDWSIICLLIDFSITQNYKLSHPHITSAYSAKIRVKTKVYPYTKCLSEMKHISPSRKTGWRIESQFKLVDISGRLLLQRAQLTLQSTKHLLSSMDKYPYYWVDVSWLAFKPTHLSKGEHIYLPQPMTFPFQQKSWTI